MTTMTSTQKADLAGAGIGDYDDLVNILPGGYHSLLDKQGTQKAIFTLKEFISTGSMQAISLKPRSLCC